MKRLYNLLGGNYSHGFDNNCIFYILLGIGLAAGGITFQCKTRKNEKELESMEPQDPMMIHINSEPQFSDQQPYGFYNNNVYPQNGTFPQNDYTRPSYSHNDYTRPGYSQNVYPPNNGYPSKNGYQNMPPQGYRYPNPVQNPSGWNTEDCPRVKN